MPPAATPPTTGPTKRSPNRLIALGVGAALLVAAGIFAITRLGDGDAAAGGAESPEAAGLALMAALEEEDALGMVDVLLPGERDTMRGPLTELVDELRRIEVLGDDASLSDMGGFDITMDDERVEESPTNVDDIVTLSLSGSIQVTVDGEALPVGDLVRDRLPDDVDLADATTESPTETFEGLPLTVVERDGRWYVSLFYTAAVAAAGSSDIPAEGVTPTGGDSPEDAFDAFLDASAALDVGGIIASLNPDEFEALQRFAPLFLDDAEAGLADVDVDVRLDEAEYDTSVDGDTASIAVTYLAGDVTAEGETASFEFADGCVRIEVPGEEPVNSCDLEEDTATMDLPPELRDGFNDVLEVFDGVFDDYENPGIVMKRVDGTWYLSPMATGADQVLSVLRALDRDEIDQVIDTVTDVGGDVVDEVVGEGDLDDAIAVPDTIEVADTVEVSDPDDTLDEGASAPLDTLEDEDPALDCYVESDATAAAECFQSAIDAGELEPGDVPVYMRAPECGLAEVYWNGELMSMADDAFVAAVEKAAPCFDELVAAGEITEDELPPELLAPECLEDRNWYTATEEDDYSDRFFDCVYR